MPERVTKEERMISLAIEKARDAKEALSLSLNDNNRSPIDDESETVKVKRPKAENVDVEIKPDGKHNGLGLGSSAYSGEETHFRKSQTPTSFEEVLQMLKEKGNSAGLNQEISSNIESLVRQEIKNGSPFSAEKLREIIETATRYKHLKNYMGFN